MQRYVSSGRVDVETDSAHTVKSDGFAPITSPTLAPSLKAMNVGIYEYNILSNQYSKATKDNKSDTYSTDTNLLRGIGHSVNVDFEEFRSRVFV